MNFNYVQKFGYAEMYELNDPNQNIYGRFVTFDKDNPSKIKLVDSKVQKNEILGVTTINFYGLSDNPLEWHEKYLHDDFGDTYMKEENIIKGKKDYDEVLELSYMKTFKDTIYEPIINEKYDKDKKYNQRIDRYEWIAVTLIGKCIIQDDGSCKSGDWCTIYNGNNSDLFGTAKKCNGYSDIKYYVIDRVSDDTILINFK